MAEGEGHFPAVLLGIVTGIALTHNGVKVSGLVILVAHIDAFLIDHVGRSLIGDLAVKVGILQSNVVVHCRRRQVVVAVGIHQTAGGVDLARQNVGDGIGAADAQTADPQAGVHIVVIQEVHLQGIGGVDQHHDAGDLALLLQAVRIGHQGSLVVVQRQVIEFGGDAVAVHIAGECTVIAFAAHTGEGDDDGIAVGSDGILHFSGIVFRIDLGDGSLTAQGGVLTAGAAFRCGVLQSGGILAVVPIPQGGIDLKAALFQCGLQAVSLGGVHVAGAGAAVGQIHGIDGQGGNLCAFCQRQSAVVHQQGCAFGFDLIAQGLTGFQTLGLGNAHALIIDGICVCILQFPEAVAGNQQGDGVVKHAQNDVHGGHDGQHHRKEDRQGLPGGNQSAFCLFIGFLFLLVGFCHDLISSFRLFDHVHNIAQALPFVTF